MRWQRKKPKKNETRVRTFFAWLPQQSLVTGEIRWLETVTVYERYCEEIRGETEPYIFNGWEVIDFV